MPSKDGILSEGQKLGMRGSEGDAGTTCQAVRYEVYGFSDEVTLIEARASWLV